MTTKEQIITDKLPQHIAIIMDGNGRWAQNQGQHRVFGHHSGVQAVRDTVEACAELGVKYLTLYAFSTENWNRPADEVQALMQLLVETIRQELPTLQKNNIRLQTIGNTDALPDDTKNQLKEAIAETDNNSRMTLVLALSYSAKWELVQAIRSIATQVKQNHLDIADIDEAEVHKALTTANIPDPELLIRTSGENRISNFLLWQIAYTELYFTPTYWPDFRKDDLYQAIVSYQNRERRFGMTGEQVK
jgi:undecaprenyl diphosphate synthase